MSTPVVTIGDLGLKLLDLCDEELGVLSGLVGVDRADAEW